MTWRRLRTLAVLVFIATGSLVEAQELRDRDRTLSASRKIAEDLRRARMHYGPFYLLSSIQLSDIGYDQEFFVPTADDRSGFSFGLAAPIRLYVTPNRKMYFSVDATPEYARFSRGNRNQWGLKSRADAQFLLNHLYLDVYAIRNNELRADVGEFQSLLTRRTNEGGVNGEFKYSSRSSVTFSALTRKQNFPLGSKNFQPDFPVNLLDRNEHAYRASFIHKTFPLTSLTVAAEHAGYSFPEAVFKNSRRDYVGVGFLYANGRTDLRAEAGPAKLNFLRANQKDFNGLIGNAALTRRFTDNWRGSLGVSRELAFSVFADNNYFVSDRAALTTEWSATKRLSLDAGYTLVYNTYDVPTAGSKHDTIELRRDRTTFPYIGFTYGNNRLRGGLDVGYLSRSSNFPILETDGVRVILHLALDL